MNSDSSTHDTGTAPQISKPKLFVPFILILLCAVAIGFGIRYYKNRPRPTTEVEWEVYFSEVNAIDNPYSLERRLVDKLGTATARVDAALYDLDAAPVTDALIAAHNRGLQVRVVTEADNIEQEIERLQDVGIPVADDGNNQGLMHHKFFVIDERYVWTGSYNTTYNGAYKNDNNVIFIDSAQLAYNFTQEFRELFLEAQVGKPSGAFVAYPKVKLSDGTEIFTYFSPEGDTISPLIREIESAEKSIHFMAFSFTHDALGNAMQDRFKSGIQVRGVFEERQVDEQYSEYKAMKAAGLPVVKDGNSGTMHHKVIVINENTVITGSYNFSKNAEKRNNENLLIIKGNRKIAEAYLAEFAKVTH